MGNVEHKIADAVSQIESVGHRERGLLVPGDKGIRGVAEAKHAATSTIDNESSSASKLTICTPR